MYMFVYVYVHGIYNIIHTKYFCCTFVYITNIITSYMYICMHMLVLNIIFDCNYMVVCLQKVVFMRDSEDTKLQLLQSRNSTTLINAIEVC